MFYFQVFSHLSQPCVVIASNISGRCGSWNSAQPVLFWFPFVIVVLPQNDEISSPLAQVRYDRIRYSLIIISFWSSSSLEQWLPSRLLSVRRNYLVAVKDIWPNMDKTCTSYFSSVIHPSIRLFSIAYPVHGHNMSWNVFELRWIQEWKVRIVLTDLTWGEGHVHCRLHHHSSVSITSFNAQ